MKKEFWIKKDPVKDGQDNWKKLSSYEFARFMETADGKSRKENIARIPGGEPGEQGQPPRMFSRAFAPPVVCPSRAGDGLQTLGFLDESQVLLNEIHRCFSWGFPVRPALY